LLGCPLSRLPRPRGGRLGEAPVTAVVPLPADEDVDVRPGDRVAETAGANWLLEYAVSRDPALRERIILAYAWTSVMPERSPVRRVAGYPRSPGLTVMSLDSLPGRWVSLHSRRARRPFMSEGVPEQVDGEPVVEVEEATEPLTAEEIREAQEEDEGS
jgi:hypothetical protein